MSTLKINTRSGWKAFIVVAISIVLASPIASAQSRSRAEKLQEARALYKQVYDLYMEGNYASAIPLSERELSIVQELFGPNNLQVAEVMQDLAMLYRNIGDYARAEPLYLQSLKIKEQLGGSPIGVAETLADLSLLYQKKGDYARAELRYQQSLEIRERILSPNDPVVATTLNLLATVYFAKGDYARAEPLYQRSLKITEHARGPNRPGWDSSPNGKARWDSTS
jgi:tetratricopeptide (TPR) repeat protein